MRLPLTLAASLLAFACSGSSGSGTLDSGAAATCGPPPPLHCAGPCGEAGGAECVDGAWVCPNLPVHCAGLDDASVDSAADGGGGDAGSQTDGGFACASCDPQTNYCEVSYGPPPNDGGSGVPSDFCEPLADCDGGGSCTCVSVGPFCSCADVSGAITVTCPFHP